MNIALIGFMGTGKSSVGRKLAERIGYKFVDLDQEIVEYEGLEIPQIFATAGEDYFREVETEVTKKIASKDKQVIATGGGVVLKEENLEALRSNGTLVLLTATSEEILKRTSHDGNRPLLEVDDPLAKIEQLLAERKDKYDCTPYQIDTTGLSLLEVVDEIIEQLEL
ncbi:shikimate kinase [Natroniella sulfidigena]|uniref:shikimate kinase n=1 Tax=Natroniella sulfidigena TaxID=723921 RepID=UPI00200A2CA9|nr:shikimate kinase [Natroniella sulfidigena]MCK8817493.1 shikimate kinase [Natroniella sulfidigena]